MKTQIKQLYRDVLTQQCALEQRMLKNALSIVTQVSDVFAYHLMKGPGFMAVVAGVVIHIAKCVPVEVSVALTDYCYNYLPVLKGNHAYFLTPQTHVFLKQGMQTACSTFVPPMYLLENSWYKLVPKQIESIPPIIMKPMTKQSWQYISPGSLTISGIYSEEDLEELRGQIMFPAERPAVLNTVPRGIMGQAVVKQQGSISNLFDENAIKKISESAWNVMWVKFMIFGNINAGIIGLIMVLRGIKLIADTIIHGYALHTVYGWSLYLFGAIWDSVTNLLLHIANVKKTPPMPETAESKPLTIKIEESSKNAIKIEEPPKNTVKIKENVGEPESGIEMSEIKIPSYFRHITDK